MFRCSCEEKISHKRLFHFCTSLLSLVIACLLCVTVINAAPIEEDPEESDFPPGLLGVYKTDKTTVKRIDPQIAFDWGNESPDVRLAVGDFEVNWSGLFLVKGSGKHKFHAYLQGDVEIILDGKIVFKGSSEKPKWVSGSDVELEFDEHEIEVKYKKTGAGAVVKLFWSSEKFAIEPLSTHLLYREAGRPDLTLLEKGRLEFNARRCDRCHLSSDAIKSVNAPSLNKISTGLSSKWIEDKLLANAGQHDRMPSFQISASDAKDIAAYLQSVSDKKTSLPKLNLKKPKEGRKKGELLVRSLGCLACHVVDGLGKSDAFGGGDLSHVGSKRSASWLLLWLRKPETLNKHTRMPTFTLSGKEALQMAAYLSELKNKEEAVSKKEEAGDVAQGKKLITTLNCAACHEIAGITKNETVVSLKGGTGKTSCLHSESEKPSGNQPIFHHTNKKSLQAWVKNLPKNWEKLAKQPHTFQQGSDVLIEKNCLACHSRDRHLGNMYIAGKVSQVDSRLKGLSQGLIPPHLTAVGDRLQDAALADGIVGKLPKRLPWLSVRMPRFKHSQKEAAALKKFLIGQDRLPDGVPDTRLQLVESGVSKTEEFLVGRELVGGRAFNCIACHKIGAYEPRNTALGTRGSDLLGMASRLRTPYFFRWTMSPLRVVPGMEMPSYHTAKPGFLDDDLQKQLSTLWKTLSNPKFKAPSNPAIVEQYLVVQPREKPVVIRDVFELQGTKERTFIPRPIVVGFENGHSVLFDLDTCAIRGWSFGDFAYQKTEGKSWFWYLAGNPIVSGFDHDSDLVLIKKNDPDEKQILPLKEGMQRAKLLEYEVNKNSIIIKYQLRFQLGETVSTITMSDKWEPYQSEGIDKDGKQPFAGKKVMRTGWQRFVAAYEVPDGYHFHLIHHSQPESLGKPVIITGSGDVFSLEKGRKASISFSTEDRSRTQHLVATYLANMNKRATQPFPGKPEVVGRPEKIAGTHGFTNARLPFSTSIMPTAITWDASGKLLFTDLKGKLFRAIDNNNDGLEDSLQLIEQGLSSPFGVTMKGNDILVAHKPELLMLRGGKTNRVFQIHADGWGHDDNYHDWITGFAYDKKGRMYVGTGSSYAQKKRPENASRFRGNVLRIDAKNNNKPVVIARGLRYPTGIANDPKGRIFTSDQQGVQNCFNEINHIIPNAAYGVVDRFDPKQPEKRAAIQIPHPWTRSVNGIFFIPDREGLGGLDVFRGHGIGCEYNNRFLIRFTLQDVEGDLQGACYAFTESALDLPPEAPTFLGPMCGAVSPDGKIYVGNIHDSGWLGGQNTGEMTVLTPKEKMPNGIREVRAFSQGFEIEFLEPVSKQTLKSKETYDLSGYTRIWGGAYASPESGRYRVNITKIEVLEKGKRVRLTVDQLKPSFVYDIHLKNTKGLFPVSAFYTMNRIPKM